MKTMLKNGKLIAFAMLTFVSMSVNAQAPELQSVGSKADRIEALRVAFISERLKLTPAEAQKFWPVYNSFRNDMETLRKNFKMGPGMPPPTADQALDFEQKKLDLKKQYKVQFEGTIGKEKVNTLFHTEEEFRQKLKDFRDQHDKGKGNHQGPPPGGPSSPGGPGRGPGGPGGSGGGGMPRGPR